MKLIAFSVLLLVILDESYCEFTSSVNKTSTSWGYDYSLSDTRGIQVKYDDQGYQIEPIYNITSSDLNKHYNSRSVYDHFTSPGGTNVSQSSTNDAIKGTSKSTRDSRPNGTVTRKVLFYTSPGGKTSRAPDTKNYTVIFDQTQTVAPVTSYESPSSSHGVPVGDVKGSANFPSNGQHYTTTFGAPYGSQNTPVYAAPTRPQYYPQAPSYGQMYGPAGGSTYDVSNGQLYRPQIAPMYGPPTGGMYTPPPAGPNYALPPQSMYAYAPQNGQMYGPPNGQMYGPPIGQMYGPANGQMYGPANGQMYGPGNGQTNSYPSGSLYVSNRNY